jgi:hypothetical protein
MSKHFGAAAWLFAALLLILQFYNNSLAQAIDATFTIRRSQPQILQIKGKLDQITGIRHLTLLREYAGIQDLAEKASDISLVDSTGDRVAFKKFQPGEYEAERDFASFEYTAALDPHKSAASAGHISWLNGNGGILFLHDLMPQMPARLGSVAARIRFELPPGWKAVGGREVGPGELEFPHVENGVVFVGPDIRIKQATVGGIKLMTAVTGNWNFADDELERIEQEVFEANRKLFGGTPANEALLILSKFPKSVPPGNWEGDTRGSTVTIVSSDMPFKTQSIQRLHEQLRHEIFHLWIPNGVNLTSSYDWFYEGFALYESLRTAVALNRIRFDDLLDTLARAHSIDTLQSQRPSLIEASKSRWDGTNTQVYARGMLVAFLCDLAIMQRGKGWTSVDDLVRSVYQTYHNAPEPRDGTDAVLSIMRSRPELSAIVDRYIRGKETINWENELRLAGIESTSANFNTTLKVVAKPSGRQKALLDKLGYNNWRKLPADSK